MYECYIKRLLDMILSLAACVVLGDPHGNCGAVDQN